MRMRQFRSFLGHRIARTFARSFIVGVLAIMISTANAATLYTPTFDSVTVNNGGSFAGTFSGAPTLSGQWTFSGGLVGSLTGSASLNLLLTGGTLTGALHMGANTLDGSAISFTGGT